MILYRRKIVLGLSALLILAGAGCLGWRSDKPDKIGDQTAPITTTSQSGIPPVVKADADKTQIIVDELVKNDADLDGLSNETEKKYGTDPNSADTDSDGLLDADEIKIYGSNPTKADSDGDGFNDGNEARAGYSPTGTGKLK